MTVNQDLLEELKQSVSVLQKRLEPLAMKNASEKATAKKHKAQTSTADKVVLCELGKLNQAVHNITTVQAEAVSMFDSLGVLTTELNEALERRFEEFRSRPIRTKHFRSEEKERARQALAAFELSDDEDETGVCLEGIKLGDGKYNEIWSFSHNVRKLQRMIKAKEIIVSIKSKGEHKLRNSNRPNQHGHPRPLKMEMNEPKKQVSTSRPRFNVAEADQSPVISQLFAETAPIIGVSDNTAVRMPIPLDNCVPQFQNALAEPFSVRF